MIKLKSIVLGISLFCLYSPAFSQPNFEKIYASIENTYYTTFPSDLLVDSYIDQKTLLDKLNLSFYSKFAGSYLTQSEIESLKSFRYLYQLASFPKSWGIGWKLGKWAKGIDINSKNEAFFLSEGDGSGQDLSPSNTFALPKDWIRVSGPGVKSNMVTDAIRYKFNDSKNAPDVKFNISKIRELLRGFFESLEADSYDQFATTFSDKQKAIIEEYGLGEKHSDLKRFFDNIRSFYVSNFEPGFKVYVNVYFSESTNYIKKLNPHSVLVELKFETSSDYFSFVLAEEGSSYKILAVRNDLDGE